MEITNPILTGFNPDPSLCRQGEDYYIATSTFEWFPGVRIYHSRDLKNWSLVSTPLDRVSMLDMKGNPDSGGIWAPCLSYADGKFLAALHRREDCRLAVEKRPQLPRHRAVHRGTVERADPDGQRRV